MVRIIAFVLAAVIVIGILGSAGFIIVKTVGYMVNQKFTIGEAISWAWQDYCEFISSIFGKAQAENEYWERDYTVNKYINVVACTAL